MTILLDLYDVFVWIINTLLRNTHLDDVTKDYISLGFNKYQDMKNYRYIFLPTVEKLDSQIPAVWIYNIYISHANRRLEVDRHIS
jgi:hypothetical protein